MCGITGWWNLNKSPINKNAFDIFVDSLSHRGPDGRGTYFNKEKNLALGHRRLSILDLSKNGTQPMSYKGRYRVTFNGEIYNFLSLKKQLVSLGHSFISNSDTEIILAAYDEWGEECQHKLDGMWAFAIWDEKLKKLFLSRDRYGEKPLFYIFQNNTFIFASEIKAFLQIEKKYQPELDNSQFSLLLNYESQEKTLLKNVFNLQAGSSITINSSGILKKEKWWNTNNFILDDFKGNYNEECKKVRGLLFDTMTSRLVTDVPFSLSVSGGLDSSSLFCIFDEILKNNISSIERSRIDDYKLTFVEYINGKKSEKENVLHLEKEKNIKIDKIKLDFNNIKPEELIKCIFDLEAIQEPHIGPWLMYKELKNQGYKVSIEGHSADEIFGGYEHQLHEALLLSFLNPNEFRRHGELKKIYSEIRNEDKRIFYRDIFFGRLLLKKIKKKVGEFYSNCIKTIFAGTFLYKILKNFKDKIKNILKIYVRKSSDNKIFKIEKLKNFKNFSDLNNILYKDFHSFTLPTILRNIDRLSMAHGVEVRSPFLNYKLVNFIFSLNENSKIGQGKTKRILRDTIKDLLPKKILESKYKTGFSTPMTNLYESNILGFFKDIVHSKNFVESDFFDGKEAFNQFNLFLKNKNITKKNREPQESFFWKNFKHIQATILKQEFKNKSNSLGL